MEKFGLSFEKFAQLLCRSEKQHNKSRAWNRDNFLKMKLLFVAFMVTLLGYNGQAQKPQGILSNGGPQKTGQKASSSKHVEARRSPPTQKVLKETSNRQRKAIVLGNGSPLVPGKVFFFFICNYNKLKICVIGILK